MTAEEVDGFLRRHWSMVIGTRNADGSSHLVTMGYALLDGDLLFTTYVKAQKTVNLQRDPRVSCLIEDIGSAYAEIQGVLLYGTVEMSDDLPTIVDYLGRISAHMGSFGRPLAPYDELDPEQVGSKRFAGRVHVTKTVSWDHGRLGGRY